MNEKLYELANDLHNALTCSEEILYLSKYEKMMLEDETLKPLFKQYNSLQDELNQLLDYNDFENEVVKTLRHKLMEVKYLIDTNENVEKYNQQYRKVNVMYKHISNVLFKEFIEAKKCKCQ